MHPESLVIRRIPVALTQVTGTTAIELSEHCMNGLERVGIEFGDLYRSVNDNCHGAKLTGKL